MEKKNSTYFLEKQGENGGLYKREVSKEIPNSIQKPEILSIQKQPSAIFDIAYNNLHQSFQELEEQPDKEQQSEIDEVTQDSVEFSDKENSFFNRKAHTLDNLQALFKGDNNRIENDSGYSKLECQQHSGSSPNPSTHSEPQNPQASYYNNQWKAVLQQGFQFIKHHKWGSPKLRLVMIDEDTKYLYWKSTKEGEKSFKGRINLSEIQDIKEGLQKTKFKSLGSYEANNCFSIITKNRTVELEGKTFEDKETFLKHFKMVLAQTMLRA